MKKNFSTELAYILGILLVALGAMLMEKGDFGVSMLNAPGYVLYRYLSPTYTFITFGMMEYSTQAILLIIMCIAIRHFQISFLFSFITSVLFGFALDGFMFIGSYFPINILWQHIYFILGALSCSAGVAFMFKTYISPEVHELFVKEVSSYFKINITKFKTAYDTTLCAIGLLLSFFFFGLWTFIGVKLGTILCAFVNGVTISMFTKLYDKHFIFVDKLNWRPFFTKATK